MPSTSNGNLIPSPSPSRTPFRLGFRAPAPEEEETAGLLSSEPPSPSSPPATGEGSGLDVEPEPASDPWDDASPSESESWDEDTPSQGRSPASSAKNPLNAEGLQDVFRGGVMIAGDQAHRLLANTPGKQAVQLYATTEADAVAIGDPLARIAGRHQGVGEVSPDTADLLAAMVGLTRYATRQIARAQDARALDAGQEPQREAVDL